MREQVSPEYIKEQRDKGWPSIHPEDYCHICGRKNPLWTATREDWLTATSAWARSTGREGICCPSCFSEIHESATGKKTSWVLVPWAGNWDVHDPEHKLLVRLDVKETYHREALVHILTYHQRVSASQCQCGWTKLGASHPEHIADIYEKRTGYRQQEQ